MKRTYLPSVLQQFNLQIVDTGQRTPENSCLGEASDCLLQKTGDKGHYLKPTATKESFKRKRRNLFKVSVILCSNLAS